MSDKPFWDKLATFLTVIDSGSLSATARALRYSQPTIRRHVEELERELGAALFSRSPNGLIPTATALALVPYVRSMQGAANALVRAAKGDAMAVSGIVRVSCSEVVASEVTPGIIAGLLNRYASLNIELVATDRVEDLLQRQADIAIRMVQPAQAALLARKVGEIRLGLFASMQYLQHHSLPGTISDLAEGQMLIGGDRDDQLQLALGERGLDLARARFALRTDSGPVQLAAIRAGLGIGVCQIGIAARDTSLVQVCAEQSFALPVWIAMHEYLRDQPAVRAVYDHLASELVSYATPTSVAAIE